MATWSKTTFAERVLHELGVLAEEQSATAWQIARTEENFDQVYNRLRPKGLVPFATSAIPEWAQGDLVNIVAYYAAPRYGYSGQRLAERKALMDEGLKSLASSVHGIPTHEPLDSDFF
jgi:hypothetical protein